MFARALQMALDATDASALLRRLVTDFYEALWRQAVRNGEPETGIGYSKAVHLELICKPCSAVLNDYRFGSNPNEISAIQEPYPKECLHGLISRSFSLVCERRHRRKCEWDVFWTGAGQSRPIMQQRHWQF